jgi:glycosyltransferase involved in cell wall biosynthesis
MEALSVIIPIYNEEKSISSTLELIERVLKNSGLEWEIIAVNDGSEDGSLSKLNEFNGVKIISHNQNRGYGASLKTGLKMAQYDNICITDADGTYPNERIPELFMLYNERKLDMLIGARNGNKVSYPFIRKIPKFVIHKVANYVAGMQIEDINSGLRIFKKEMAQRFYQLFPDGFSFTTTLTLAALTNADKVEFISIDYFKRTGKSKISPLKDTLGFFYLLSLIMIYFNPFKLFFPPVVMLFLISFIYILRDFFVTRNLSEGSVLFPILTLNLFFMGLIADMISKK